MNVPNFYIVKSLEIEMKSMTVLMLVLLVFSLFTLSCGDDDDDNDDADNPADDDADDDVNDDLNDDIDDDANDDTDDDLNDDLDDDVDDDVNDDVDDDIDDDVDDDDTTPPTTTTTTAPATTTTTVVTTTTTTTLETTTTTTVGSTTTSTTTTQPVLSQLCMAESVIVGSLDEDNDGDLFTEAQGDCNDDEAAAKPGGVEILDGIDNNCDGWIDEGFDSDCDGFPDTGAALAEEDCDIQNALIYPGAPEIPNDGVDQDCDGADLIPSDDNGVFVDPSGDDGNPGTMAEPKLTVQAGVDLAEMEGKVVFVSGYSYDESVTTSVSIYGYSPSSNTNQSTADEAYYTIKSVGAAAVTVEEGANVAIYGLILTGGETPDPAISLIVRGKALVQYCDIRPDNWVSSASESYGIVVDGGFAWSRKNTYEGSSTPKSVAMEVREGGTLVSDDDWTLFAFGGTEVGYAVNVVNGFAIVDKAFFTIRGDEASLIRVEENGAAVVQNGDFGDSNPDVIDGMMVYGRLTVRDTSMYLFGSDTQSNAARVYGTASFINCEFTAGSGQTSYGIVSETGSTVYVKSSGITSGAGTGYFTVTSVGIHAKGEVRVEDSNITGDGSCPDLGYHYQSTGMMIEGSAVVQRSTIVGLGAETAYGIVSSGTTNCANSVIIGWGGGLPDWGNKGIGVWAYGGVTTMVNNVVKLYSNGEAAGARIDDPAEAVFINNVIDSGYDNYNYGDPEPTYGFRVTGSVSLINNNITSAGDHCMLSRSGGVQCAPTDVNACDWTGCAEASGNMDTDPQFAGTQWSSRNFHLLATSPMIDAGVDPVSWYSGDLADYDMDGEQRPLDSGWDIGPDEFSE